MVFKQLNLTNFRSFQAKKLNFSTGDSLIVDDNGAGKTNVLEAIFLLSTGRSFRATKENQMICNGEELARVEAELEKDRLEIVLTIGQIAGQPAPRKRYLVNGVAKRRMDFIGKLRVVLFRPEDIDLVLGSPSLRRNYLDTVLEPVDWQYRRSNLAYQKGLRQRNKVLQRIREGEAKSSQLLFWDKLLVKNGELISQKREGLIEFINQQLEIQNRQVKLVYDHSFITPERLEKYQAAEVAAGATLVGPHRDDLQFVSKIKTDKDLALYGSRGAQRMAVLGLKLAELVFVEEKTTDKPLLLLDDIFSELDADNREEVWQAVNRQQAIMTSTGEDLVKKKTSDKIKIIKL